MKPGSSRACFAMPQFIQALLCAAALVGCSGEDGTGPLVPGPHVGVDEIVFNVFRADASGQEHLAWRGTVDGPRPGSPESTPIPTVGFLQSFRVSWEANSANAPIVGTRIRVSRIAAAHYFALDPIEDSLWGRGTSFTFANEVPATELSGRECATGPDCPDLLRFDAGLCSLSVLAINAIGEPLESDLGKLRFRVNFAPQASWVMPGEDEMASPFWTAPALEGGTLRRALVAGDTIPSGVRVQLTLRGRDRIFGMVAPDSACCDQRLDDGFPLLRFQARTHIEQHLPSSVLETRQTIFGSLAPDSLLSLLVGPFDYRLGGRVADEHSTRSAEVEMSFVVGLRPGMPDMDPATGSQFELLHPGEPIAVGDEGPLYQIAPTVRYWSPTLQDWSRFGEGSQWNGVLYQIPLRLRAEPHPLVREIHPILAEGPTDHVRAFSYELVGEFDPSNLRVNGAGDLLTKFLDSNVAEGLALAGEQGFEIFIPDFFWSVPSWYVPEIIGETACQRPELPEFCDMGDRIRSDLGRFTFRAQSRTTSANTNFDVLPPLPADSTGVEIPLDLDRFGRTSQIREQHFAVRLSVPLEGHPEPVLWPAVPEGF